MSKYSIQVFEEKTTKSKIKLKDLPATTCFKDQYGNILMRLTDDVYQTVLCEKSTSSDGVIWCVYLTFCGVVKGGLIAYSPEQEVTPYITEITVKEQE
jgi:hypothetical protein